MFSCLNFNSLCIKFKKLFFSAIFLDTRYQRKWRWHKAGTVPCLEEANSKNIWIHPLNSGWTATFAGPVSPPCTQICHCHTHLQLTAINEPAHKEKINKSFSCVWLRSWRDSSDTFHFPRVTASPAQGPKITSWGKSGWKEERERKNFRQKSTLD